MAQGFKKYQIIDKTYHITTVQLPVLTRHFHKEESDSKSICFSFKSLKLVEVV